ncbi:hypothetical protein HYH02_012634 [Chlamydomonas schloesseri]|uniref:Uncharacterized protein n=1 Tax=Chlamydomonas schloesseri TaxID=2026947 RepID=A0A835SXD8_9CHLO|nr:hypothetical protein HYH02_012634 [Chlamydomonas schloesseri]|eukprot:KAG2433516.1 hypothetical protein HYH02_012634 [Chlamydomonas schloesseri]
MAPVLARAELKAVAQPATKAVPVVQRRAALATILAPLASVVLAAPAMAAGQKNLSRAELLQQQRAERKEAMKVRNAKVRAGEVKPAF